ncbi:hypothetical protein [Azotobacter vinelandii]|uniref:hypothetical protein n=1 Tax=Azotobacter vinelandii TaxID=354 RepID=UPI002666CD7A|nr:hypothetical protein [Azotobacter vinelandii]WKN23604.1 hypothetical protein AVAEIV_001692 [Azotobacter vinelandii]
MRLSALRHPGFPAPRTRKPLLSLAVLTLLFAYAGAYAEILEQPVRKDGLSIYYGVLPAELVKPQELELGTHMEPSRARDADTHHLVVALFDHATGKRLTNATVQARVEPLGGAAQQKTLEPMQIAGTVTFGNFFRMDADMPYVIHLRIRRNDGHSPEVEVALPYRHPSR